MNEAKNKYDLEERTAKLGENIIEFCKSIKQDVIAKPIINQLIRSGISIGANYRHRTMKCYLEILMHSKLIQNSKFKIQNSLQGFSLVEVILSTAVFALLITALVGAYLYGEESTMMAGNRARANMLAEEGLEAARNIRDANFANLTDGAYGLATTSNQWILSGSPDTNDIFTRQIIISTVDTKRKSVTANVSWQQNPQRTGLVSLVTRFTNWIAAGIGNWASPIQTGNTNISGNQNGLKIAVQDGYAFAVMDGGSPDFIVFNISNPDNPIQTGGLTLNGTPRDIEISGNYAYVASTDNGEELKIIDISNPAFPAKVGWYNAPGDADGNAVALNGNIVYLARVSSGNAEFQVVNVTVKTAPVGLGSVNLGANANEVKILGNYAYVASDSNSQELQIVSVSNPSAPALVGSYNIPGNDNGETVAVFGTTVIVGTLSSGDLRIFDVTSPTSPIQIGFYDGGDNIRDIALGNNNQYAFLATDANNAEFQVVDISILPTPQLAGSFDVNGNNDLNGVAYHATKDRAYVVGDSNSEELIVIAPQ